MNYTILILGGGLQAISTARSLKDAGYRVGIFLNKKDYSSSSSALDFKIIDSAKIDVEKIQTIIREYGIHVIIPMSDNMALFLSKYKRNIQQTTSCKVAVPDYETIELAADKIKLMGVCKKFGFPHPVTIADTELSAELIRSLKFPVLIKPNRSVGARGIKKIDSPSELIESLPIIQQQFGGCHIQEFIAGQLPYYNVMIYRDQYGNILNHTILKIIRFYPLSGGSSCLCESVEIPELVELCKNVLEVMHYVGFADFDILQTINGEYKIIEINPRVPASLRGAAISGVNFPALIAADCLGIKHPTNIYTPGKTLRYLGLDLMWFISSPNRFHTYPSWLQFFGKNIFYQEGGWKDWKPMITSLLSSFNKIEFKNGRIKKKQL